MTPEEIDELADYTPAQHVKRIDYLLATGQAGTSYTIRGRSFTHPTIEALMKMRDYYAALALDEAGVPDGPMGHVALARFGEMPVQFPYGHRFPCRMIVPPTQN